MLRRWLHLARRVGSTNVEKHLLAFVYEKDVVNKLFDEIAPRYQERSGGYTQLTKLGPRLGDGAPMVQLELIK